MMKETLESIAIMVGIIVVAEVINEIAGYKLVEVDFSKQSPKKRKCN
jgi:hypothetical protein